VPEQHPTTALQFIHHLTYHLSLKPLHHL